MKKNREHREKKVSADERGFTQIIFHRKAREGREDYFDTDGHRLTL